MINNLNKFKVLCDVGIEVDFVVGMYVYIKVGVVGNCVYFEMKIKYGLYMFDIKKIKKFE